MVVNNESEMRWKEAFVGWVGGTAPEFNWRDWGKPRKFSGRMSGDPAKTPNSHWLFIINFSQMYLQWVNTVAKCAPYNNCMPCCLPKLHCMSLVFLGVCVCESGHVCGCRFCTRLYTAELCTSFAALITAMHWNQVLNCLIWSSQFSFRLKRGGRGICWDYLCCPCLRSTKLS